MPRKTCLRKSCVRMNLRNFVSFVPKWKKLSNTGILVVLICLSLELRLGEAEGLNMFCYQMKPIKLNFVSCEFESDPVFCSPERSCLKTELRYYNFESNNLCWLAEWCFLILEKRLCGLERKKLNNPQQEIVKS